MQYPLSMTFKIMALAPQIYVHDANGDSVCYVKQKLLKLKEAVNVFSDSTQQNLLCQIKADRIIDFSAKYQFEDAQGNPFGTVGRKGAKSIFKAHYDVMKDGQPVMNITEDNGWVKVLDATVGELPIIGMFTGYFFNPSYTLETLDGQEVMRLKKEPAFLEGKFTLEKFMDLDEETELQCLMSFLMMTLLERKRG